MMFWADGFFFHHWIQCWFLTPMWQRWSSELNWFAPSPDAILFEVNSTRQEQKWNGAWHTVYMILYPEQIDRLLCPCWSKRFLAVAKSVTHSAFLEEKQQVWFCGCCWEILCLGPQMNLQIWSAMTRSISHDHKTHSTSQILDGHQFIQSQLRCQEKVLLAKRAKDDVLGFIHRAWRFASWRNWRFWSCSWEEAGPGHSRYSGGADPVADPSGSSAHSKERWEPECKAGASGVEGRGPRAHKVQDPRVGRRGSPEL